MQKLVLGKNNIGDDGAKLMASCIDKMLELDLEQCKIGKTGLQKLVDGIQNRSTPVGNKAILV